MQAAPRKKAMVRRLTMAISARRLPAEYPAESWNKAGHLGGISLIGVAKRDPRVVFLSPRQPDVHHGQYWKHGERQDGRPLQQEAEHHQDEPDILRVSHIAVGPSRRQAPRLLRTVQHLPGSRDQDEPTADKNEAKDVERTEMWIGLPAEHHFQKVTGIMREPVHVRISRLQPPRQEVDRKRKSIHLRKQCDQERAEGAERTPVAWGLRLEECIGKEDEDGRVDNDKAP